MSTASPSRSRRVLHLSALGAALVSSLALSVVACSSEDGGDPDVDPIAWVSPTASSEIEVDDAVQLTVKVNEPAAKVVRFQLDGKEIGVCDVSKEEDECHTGDLFRTTFTFVSAGKHQLTAVAPLEGGDLSASLSVTVSAGAPNNTNADAGEGDASSEGDASDASVDAGPGKDSGPTTPPADRGFLDPDKPSHNVFGGVSWSVKNQSVKVASPPSGSTSAVAQCMKTYGKSIIKYADQYKVSRASVVATAITESNCTNPAGSSDGLSSGPMQVTGSTCTGVVSGYTSAGCKKKMHDDPDFSFLVGVKYMGSSYQLKQHDHDPPKIAAAYNAGSIRQSSANRWHMIVTGNHIERFVGAYNAYRDWETMNGVAKASLEKELDLRPIKLFAGEHVGSFEELPSSATPGQVYFVGNWATREGAFVTFHDGAWQAD